MYIVRNARGAKEYTEENGMNEVLLPRDSIITPLLSSTITRVGQPHFALGRGAYR